MELEITEFDLRAVVERATEVLTEPARAKGLEVLSHGSCSGRVKSQAASFAPLTQ